MKVTLFGATGIVGRAVLRHLLDCGYEVNVLTRHPEKINENDSRLHVFVGEVINPADVQRALDGSEAVIQTIGIGGKGDGRKTTVVSDANRVIMRCMERAGIKRYVAISVIGAGDSIAFLPAIYRRVIMPLFQRWFIPIIDDKNRMEADIFKSNLDWTVVRGTTVKERKPTGKIKASLDGKGIGFSISADGLADFMVRMIKDRSYLHECPTVSD